MNELSPEARSLIESARDGAPTISKRARATMRWALLSSMAPAVAAASLGKMLLVGVVSAAVGAGVTAVTIEANRSPAPVRNTNLVSVPPMKPAVVVSPAPVGSPPSPVMPEPVAQPLPVVRAPPARKAVEPPPVVEVVASPAPRAPIVDDSMAAELEAMSRIVASVDGKRWGDASAALSAFRARFVHPTLSVESEVLEVRILCGQGEVRAANERATQLKMLHPRNPSVQRLPNACVK